MSGQWAAWASATVIAALYGGIAVVSKSSSLRLRSLRTAVHYMQLILPDTGCVTQSHGRGGRLLHIQAAPQPPLRTG